MYNIPLDAIPLRSLIADIIFAIALPSGIWGLILIFKDWLHYKKHDSQNLYKDYHDK